MFKFHHFATLWFDFFRVSPELFYCERELDSFLKEQIFLMDRYSCGALTTDAESVKSNDDIAHVPTSRRDFELHLAVF